MKEAPKVRMSTIRFFRKLTTNPIDLRTEIYHKYGDIAQYRLRGMDTYYLFHPDYAQQVFGEKNDLYPEKNRLLVGAFAPIGGRVDLSVFLNNDLDRWRKDRQIAQMSFDEKAHYGEYAEKIAELTAVD